MSRKLLVLSVVAIVLASSGVSVFAIADNNKEPSYDDPDNVLQQFLDICKVPRCSYYDVKIGQYLMDFAEQYDLPHSMDAAGNVYIDHPGERGGTMILQAHQDMVEAVAPGYVHDFTTQGIDTVIKDGWVHSVGTTLGADDGSGLATLLCALISPTLDGIAFRCIFTVDEEVGLLGAKALDSSWLSGYKYLVNVDSEKKNVVTIGCAGGVTLKADFTPEFSANTDKCYKVSLSGLLGGHSGHCVGLGRANALIEMSKFIDSIDGARLVSFIGGNMDNAIPNSATLTIAVPAGVNMEEKFNTFQDYLKGKYSSVEHDLLLKIADEVTAATAWTAESTKKVVKTIIEIPYDVFERSDEGVISSSNTGLLKKVGDKIELSVMIRSAKNDVLLNIKETDEGILAKYGFNLVSADAYSGWLEDKQNDFVKMTERITGDVFGTPAILEITHGGLECGTFAEKCPSLVQVSIGPELPGVHTVDEHMEIDSLIKTKDIVFKLVLETADEA